MNRKPTNDKVGGKVGGLAFFLSIPALFLIVTGALLGILYLIKTKEMSGLWWLLIGMTIGFLISPIIIGKLYVFMHEVKHAIVASLAGNKWKKLTIDGGGGAYEYSYTKKTAHLNAFIALAPYWFPLLTVPVALFGLTKAISYEGIRLLLGAVFAIDLYTGFKDLGPHQSDLSNIRGGSSVAILYVILMNALTTALVLAWAISGLNGFSEITYHLWDLCSKLFLNTIPTTGQ